MAGIKKSFWLYKPVNDVDIADFIFGVFCGITATSISLILIKKLFLVI